MITSHEPVLPSLYLTYVSGVNESPTSNIRPSKFDSSVLVCENEILEIINNNNVIFFIIIF